MSAERTGKRTLPPVSVMIVDGEPGSRGILEDRFREDRDFRVVGVFADRVAGRAALRRRRPRVVVADVAGAEGMTWVSRDVEHVERVLVLLGTTDGDARRAFDLGAGEFLRRPVDGERVRAVLGRLRRLRRPPRGWFAVPGSHGPFLVRREALERAEKGGARTLLHGAFGTFEAAAPLDALVPCLAEAGLVRVSAGALVRRDAVREVRPEGAETWRLVLRSGAVVASDAEHMPRVERLIDTLRAAS